VRTLLALAVAASAALAWDWQFELVDTSGSRSDPQFTGSPDGVLHFCYFDGPHREHVVHSFYDSTWHREQPGMPQWPMDWDMDVGPHGEVGACVASASMEPRYEVWEKHGTAWTGDSVPFAVRDSVFLAFDTSGAPGVAFGPGFYQPYPYVYAHRTDSTWTAETALVSGSSRYLQHLVHTAENEPCLLVCRYEIAISYALEVYRKQGDSWPMTELVSGWRGGAAFKAWASRPDSGISVCFSYGDEQNPDQFCYGEPGRAPLVLEWVWVSTAAMALDELGRPHIAYVLGDSLVCVWQDDQLWHRSAVCGAAGLSLAGIAQSGYRPVIGFVDSLNHVWVARAVPSGIQERGVRNVPDVTPTATIVHAVLWLASATSRKPQAASWLLDVSGRKVLDLHPGANDVRALAAGVYFVCKGAGTREQVGDRVSKIVVTR